ncbi:MAG: family 1 glycosylhydrolase, partial [Oscillospiraceae bacterium]|nr:family 1 glycosylhydrolase [Oscillospiraceae bacterium]
PAGLAYYRRLIDLLNENGIVPNATIYHWDLPYALQIQGGCGNREIVEWYTRYTEILLDNFGKDVPIWVTFNEPIATYVGHAQGFFASGLVDEKYARQCIHHLLLCHGAAVKLFRRKHLENARIGIVVDVWKHFPAHPGTPADEAMAEYNNECTGYGMFLHPLFLGGYSDILTRYMTEHDMTPKMETGDFEAICQPLDFYGLNFYNGLIDDAAAAQEQAKAGGKFQDRPENRTEKLYEILHMLVKDYHISGPIYLYPSCAAGCPRWRGGQRSQNKTAGYRELKEEPCYGCTTQCTYWHGVHRFGEKYQIK